MNRRDVLKTMGAAVGSTFVAAKSLHGEEAAPTDPGSLGILVDTTRCLGCRMCEMACVEAHQEAGLEFPNDVDLSVERTTSDNQWTVVNRYDTDKGEVYRKSQCMHCLTPACASACLTKAMHKTPAGPVAWDVDRCMGCRFCMVSCPFDVPKFEYDSPTPLIQKCTMCWDRVSEGGVPACVEACPAGALSFGQRADLMDEANDRIYHTPDTYIHQVYGEHEAGGTGYLYLSAVPFEQLGLRTDLATTAYPTFTREFLYGVPVVLTLVPPFLVALNRAVRDRSLSEGDSPKETDK